MAAKTSPKGNGEVQEMAREIAREEQYRIPSDRSEPQLHRRNTTMSRNLPIWRSNASRCAGVREAKPPPSVRDLRGTRCRRQGRRHQAHYRSAQSAHLPRVRPRHAHRERARAMVFSAANSAELPSAGEIVLFHLSGNNRGGRRACHGLLAATTNTRNSCAPARCSRRC